MPVVYATPEHPPSSPHSFVPDDLPRRPSSAGSLSFTSPPSSPLSAPVSVVRPVRSPFAGLPDLSRSLPVIHSPPPISAPSPAPLPVEPSSPVPFVPAPEVQLYDHHVQIADIGLALHHITNSLHRWHHESLETDAQQIGSYLTWPDVPTLTVSSFPSPLQRLPSKISSLRLLRLLICAFKLPLMILLLVCPPYKIPFRLWMQFPV